jgi:hypothetical protein
MKRSLPLLFGGDGSCFATVGVAVCFCQHASAAPRPAAPRVPMSRPSGIGAEAKERQRAYDRGVKDERGRWMFWLSRITLFGAPGDPLPPGFKRAPKRSERTETGGGS